MDTGSGPSKQAAQAALDEYAKCANWNGLQVLSLSKNWHQIRNSVRLLKS